MLLGMIQRKWRIWQAQRKWKAAQRWVKKWRRRGGDVPDRKGLNKPKDAIDTNSQ